MYHTHPNKCPQCYKKKPRKYVSKSVHLNLAILYVIV